MRLIHSFGGVHGAERLPGAVAAALLSRALPAIVVFFLVLPAAPGPSHSLEGQEIFDTWQERYIVPGSEGKVLEVPYVQTDDYIAREMFRLLALQPGDVFYDLGCGDGRLVIAAVRHPGVRGVGIDIDQRRIAESKANALSAGVSDRTAFIRQDLFQSHIGDATAISIFLLPELNVRLRPKLFRDLRPGTRIVSHNFDMGDWKPDRTVFAGMWFDGPHNVHYWVIPANISGRWQGRNGKDLWSLSITQRFQNVEGNLSVNNGPTIALASATVTGERFRFVANMQNPRRQITFDGKVTGNLLEGTVLRAGGTASRLRAARDPGTISAIDEGQARPPEKNR
jgi:SAM-dependent methyltransferase